MNVFFCWLDGEQMKYSNGIYICACGVKATEEFMEGLRALVKPLRDQANDISRELQGSTSN